MNNRSLRLLSTALAVALSGVASLPLQASVDPDPPAHFVEADVQPETFPLPAALRDNVAFWRSVFTEWRQSQVALHDMNYPAIVYDVIELDGKVGDSLSEAQREQIKQHREAWEARLQAIAAAGQDGTELSDQDRDLRQRLINAGGAAAVAEAYLRVRTQRGVRERFRRGLEISGRYDAAFRRAFQEAGLPEDLAYLPHVESSFQYHAKSAVGAVGMWQFTRSAGQTFMTVDKAVDERLDPVASARGAARYLKHAYKQLGDWSLAITSYNHGIQGMARAKAEFGGDFGRIVQEYKGKTFGFASRNFYAEFLAAREIASQPERFFPEGVAFEAPLRADHIVLDRPARSRDLAQRYGVTHSELVKMNPAWGTRASRSQTAIPAGVMVTLPSGTLLSAAVQNTALLAAATRKDDAPREAATRQAKLHVVKASETLSGIARRYKIEVTALRTLNELPAEQDLLRVGQKLKVRDDGQSAGNDAVVHVVRKGDTPWLIASNYGVTVAELLASNQLTKRSVIRPGQRLGIPANR
ncbi:MAG: LysM peptidoglycan-binding domain-containing protein [Pseudomonadota bacterium]